MAVKPGDILRDKLRIDALIGRGGMGHVFAATDLETRAQVAVKVVSRLFVDEVMMQRLHREAQAAQRIQSDFVPRVLEVNDTGKGETYLVMERLVGESLSQRIRNNGALPWSEVSRIGEDVLRGIIDAHDAGIIHRDLKPSNVFLALKAGRVRAMVLDFGVCKMDGIDTERLTGTGESIGTVAYMAPEQIRGAARVDERADLFAFGVVVFEMLSGRLPHEGPSQMAILASKLENPSARLRDCARVDIPEGVDAIVMRALAREPAARQANARDVLEQWRLLPKGEGVIGAQSIPPPPLSSGQDLTVSKDPPTEISRPSFDRVDGDDDEGLPPTGDAAQHASELAASFPREAHPTQTALTSSALRLPGSGGGRLAMMIGSTVVVVGLLIVAFAFSRPDPPVHVTASAELPPQGAPAASTAPEERASIPPPEAPDEPPEPSDPGANDLELPADPAKPVAPRSRPRPRRPPATSTTKGTPHMTSQPRF